jgi:hypothetical protein
MQGWTLTGALQGLRTLVISHGTLIEKMKWFSITVYTDFGQLARETWCVTSK